MTWLWDPDELAEIEAESKPRPTVSFDAAMTMAVERMVGDFANGGRNSEPAIRNLSYADYLRSPHWLHIRRRMLAQAGYECRECRATDTRLDVHHLSYDRLGRELDADLTVLCYRCHAMAHGKDAESVDIEDELEKLGISQSVLERFRKENRQAYDATIAKVRSLVRKRRGLP